MPDPTQMTETVHAYLAAFDAADPNAIAALYAEQCTVEDPIGSQIHHGRAAIRAFYAEAMKTGAKLKLEGPIRIAGDYAAFAFSANLHYEGGNKRIDVIDTFKFNEQNEVTEMRAFWGPTNMQGF